VGSFPGKAPLESQRYVGPLPHWLQAGPSQLYVLYVAMAILVLLVWKLR